jgi:hypothetical protein
MCTGRSRVPVTSRAPDGYHLQAGPQIQAGSRLQVGGGLNNDIADYYTSSKSLFHSSIATCRETMKKNDDFCML